MIRAKILIRAPSNRFGRRTLIRAIGQVWPIGRRTLIRALELDSGNRANLGKRAIGRRMLIRTSMKMLRGVLPGSVRIKLEVRTKSNAKTIGRQVQTAAAQIASQHSCKVIGQSGVRLPGCQNHYQAPRIFCIFPAHGKICLK